MERLLGRWTKGVSSGSWRQGYDQIRGKNQLGSWYDCYTRKTPVDQPFFNSLPAARPSGNSFAKMSMAMILTPYRTSSLFVRSRKGSFHNLSRKRKKKKMTEYPRHMRRGQRRKQDKLKTILNRLRKHLFSGVALSYLTSLHPLRVASHRPKRAPFSPDSSNCSVFSSSLSSSCSRLPSSFPPGGQSVFPSCFFSSFSTPEASTAMTPTATTTNRRTLRASSCSPAPSSCCSCRRLGVCGGPARERRGGGGRGRSREENPRVVSGRDRRAPKRKESAEDFSQCAGLDGDLMNGRLLKLSMLPFGPRRTLSSFSSSFASSAPSRDARRPLLPSLSSTHSCCMPVFPAFLRGTNSLAPRTLQQRTWDADRDVHLLFRPAFEPLSFSLSSLTRLFPFSGCLSCSSFLSSSSPPVLGNPCPRVISTCTVLQSRSSWDPPPRGESPHTVGSSKFSFPRSLSSPLLHSTVLSRRSLDTCPVGMDRTCSFSPSLSSSFRHYSSFALKRLKGIQQLGREPSPLFSSSCFSLRGFSSSSSSSRGNDSQGRASETPGPPSALVRSSANRCGVYGGAEEDRARRGGQEEEEEARAGGVGTIEMLGPLALSRTILKAFR